MFSKMANVTFFRMVTKNNPAEFRFPTPLQSGRKSLKPKCSGSSRNQLVRILLHFGQQQHVVVLVVMYSAYLHEIVVKFNKICCVEFRRFLGLVSDGIVCCVC